MKDANQNSSRTFVSAYVPRAPDQGPAPARDDGSAFADHQIRPAGHLVWPARGPGCNGAPCAKVIVPTRVPTLPSRYRNGGYGSGLLVVPDEPDGDSQLRHWHRCIPVGQSIDDRSRLDRAMPRARSRSVNLLYGAKRRSASPKSVARYLCLWAGRDRPAGWESSNTPIGEVWLFFGYFAVPFQSYRRD